MRYGYIGIGQMGSAMAQRLVSTGAEVTVFDLDHEAVQRVVAAGATAAGSAAAVAAVSDVVSICVPAAHHLAAVLTGPDGLAGAARPGLAVLVHSTVHPSTVQAARDTAAEWGVALFDACVAGGTEAAARGEVALFAGGLDSMPSPVVDLLHVYASKVIAAGPVGAGAALKIACNLMTYAQFAAASASLDMVASAGVEPALLLDAWRHIGQLGRLTEHVVPLLADPASMSDGFRRSTTAIAEKDLDLAVELGGGRDSALTDVVRAIRDSMSTVWHAADHLDPEGEH